jgi:hypothetical protein
MKKQLPRNYFQFLRYIYIYIKINKCLCNEPFQTLFAWNDQNWMLTAENHDKQGIFILAKLRSRWVLYWKNRLRFTVCITKVHTTIGYRRERGIKAYYILSFPLLQLYHISLKKLRLRLYWTISHQVNHPSS